MIWVNEVCMNINNSSTNGFLTFLRTTRPLGISHNLDKGLLQCNKSMFLAQIILNVFSKSRWFSNYGYDTCFFCALLRNFNLHVCFMWSIEQHLWLYETNIFFYSWLKILSHLPFSQDVTLINSIKACHTCLILNGVHIISLTGKKLLLV